MRQQNHNGGSGLDGGRSVKMNNNNNDSTILSNDSLNGSNLFTAVPTQSPSGLTSSTSGTTPTSSTNILSPSVSSYLQQQSVATDILSNKADVSTTPIATQINKILKKPKKDNEKIMLLSDDEF